MKDEVKVLDEFTRSAPSRCRRLSAPIDQKLQRVCFRIEVDFSFQGIGMKCSRRPTTGKGRAVECWVRLGGTNLEKIAGFFGG